MKIIELNVIQFGKLKDRSFAFSDGFNIVRGNNESGKSTLLAFIKFVLYGVARKNPNVAVGERERALSWNYGIAAGSVIVEDVDKKQYRIERTGREDARGSYSDKAKIIDLETGEEVFSGEIPGEHFLGINAQGYDSMCNIKQLETVAVGADAVKSVIDNLLSSGDENTSIQSATKALDGERRRLLHVNGKGGLIYDVELALERLISEHRGAVIFENECVKNRDELERVELALAKAREEHEVAQKMCDAHDDVLRLQKFDGLRELEKQNGLLRENITELEGGAGFRCELASYELLGEMRSARDSLERTQNAFDIAQRELDSADSAFSGVKIANSEGFAEILDELGSPDGAVSYLGAKKKKRSSSALSLVVCGVGGVLLLAFALVLALLMNNIAGAMTVAFIGIVLAVVSFVSYKKFASAKADIRAFMEKMGEGFCSKDEKKILEALDTFYGKRNLRLQRSNALESAKFRYSMAEENYIADLSVAKRVLDKLDFVCPEGDEAKTLSELIEKMRSYLADRAAKENALRENEALIKSLKTELERFSEDDIRQRVTDEVREKIKNTSFERLKAERDSALYRTNQFNQYKAGIERNFASSEHRRSSSDIFPEIEAQKERLDALKLRYDAIKLARDTINEASASLKGDLTPRIRESAQRNLSTVTAGKYSELYIDENMGLSVFADGATRPIESLSKGSLDVAYFSVRLALLQTLLGEKEPPLYMDETLSQLDDGRAENTLSAIADHAKSSQCILFTCQNRDVELAKRLTEVNIISLD